MSDQVPYAVTLDVNIYLTVARELGAGFSLADFYGRVKAAQQSGNDVFCLFATLLAPHPDGGKIEIWTGEHIVKTALYKARQPSQGSRSEATGLGWTPADSQCIADLVMDLKTLTGGGFLLQDGTYFHPPMDYEDGCVMQCAKKAHSDSGLCKRICITYDKEMIIASRRAREVEVLSPEAWCARVKMIRRSRQIARIRGNAQ
ncbi:hypothetical protein KIM372_01310 [Bombiscardovia nodaiensis]|uniref:PIN domain-containing protein n=1 Tax=Bombiscardovia nodaiensis TaxID=2932181 RepID=A0ABM8B6D5_9BIFI|nr:hypothetical protein KIM372_01310 [Bombiscardovia nodaiensis]